MGFDSKVVDMLKRLGKPFRMEITNSTIKIIKEDGDKYILSAKDLSFKSLAFIKNVKNDGLRYDNFLALKLSNPVDFYKWQGCKCLAIDTNWGANLRGLPFVRAKDINYFRWNNISEGVYYDIVEIDVNNAYWNKALEMGVISPATYIKGLNDMEKMDRLIGLGSLATITEKYQYEPETGQIRHTGRKVNEFTRNIFFNIAKRIDNLISGIFEKAGTNNVVFYWVDALFCRTYAVDFIKAEFEAQGIETKTKIIQSMNVYQKGREKKVCILETKTKHETYTDFEQRFFSIPPPIEKRLEFMKEMFSETLANIPVTPQRTQIEIDKIIEREKYGDDVPF